MHDGGHVVPAEDFEAGEQDATYNGNLGSLLGGLVEALVELS